MRTNDGNFGDVALATAALEKEAVDPRFQCGICKSSLSNAVSTPCCKANYCDKCVRKQLVASGFKCPGCETQISPDQLVPNKELRQEIETARRNRLKDLMSEVRDKKNQQDGGAPSAGGANGGGGGGSSSLGETISSSATKIVRQDPRRGLVTEYLDRPYRYEEVQRGQFMDKFINGEKVCRTFDSEGRCSFGDQCQFLHAESDGSDLRGTREERRARQAEKSRDGGGGGRDRRRERSRERRSSRGRSRERRRSRSKDRSRDRDERKSSRRRSRSRSSERSRSHRDKDRDRDRDRDRRDRRDRDRDRDRRERSPDRKKSRSSSRR